jgi:hypothetical protein
MLSLGWMPLGPFCSLVALRNQVLMTGSRPLLH